MKGETGKLVVLQRNKSRMSLSFALTINIRLDIWRDDREAASVAPQDVAACRGTRR